MANINQTIIIRTDIFNLPNDVGLIAAQVAHIHCQINRQIFAEHRGSDRIVDFFKNVTKEWQEWMSDPYLLVKRVPNLEALHYFQTEAINKELPVQQWKDTINVRLSPNINKAFSDVLVGIAIGPEDSDKIKAVVGDLPLL